MTESESGSRRQPIRSYEDLETYQRAMALLPLVHKLALRFPDYERYELASQIRRSSKSIVANTAEGFGRKRSVRDFKSYLNNALGSTNETMVHLRIAEALDYAPNAEVQPLVDSYTIVAKQLHRLMENWRDFSVEPTIVRSRQA